MNGTANIPVDTLLEKAPEAADFMRQFSNANRLMLLCYIAGNEKSVSEIQEGLGIKQPALSQQLGELRQSGLVKTRRESRMIYYSIADGRTRAVMDLLYGMFCDPPSGVTQDTSLGSSLVSIPSSSFKDASDLRPVREAGVGDAAHFARLLPAE